jgi:hypothetical protein
VPSRLRWFCLLVGLLCCLPASAGDEASDAKKADPADKETKEKLVRLGSITGKLTKVDGAQRSLTVQITVPVAQPSSSHGYSGAARGRPRTQSYRIQNKTINVDLEASENVKVRTEAPPKNVDENGKPKKYTTKELQELKGPDPKLTGYTADFDSLKTGQMVKVYMARKKDNGKSAANGTDKGSNKEKPLATTIVILNGPKK